MAKQTLRSRLFGSALTNAVGYAFGTAAAPALEPEAQVVANEAWEALPHKPLSAAAAAEAAARGVLTDGEGRAEALSTGINADRFATLRALAEQFPPPETVLELLRRGDIGEAEASDALSRRGLSAFWRTKTLGLRRYLVPPSDLIRMAVREVFSDGLRQSLNLDANFPEVFAEKAALLGIDRETARDYWAAHWQLPSYEQAAEMLFRGAISPEQFTDLLRALDYAPVWRGPLEEIARRIPTMTDFTEMAVREVFNPTQRAALGLDNDYPEEFTAKAALHGMVESDARDIWAKHWRLPSALQGYRMLWRKRISPSELDDLLKALDYSSTWREHLREIAYLVPGRVDLRRMLAARVVDRAYVKEGYENLGYTAEVAETLTTFAEFLANGGEARKSETVAELRSEYEGGYITEAEFRSALEALGYTATATTHLVELGDARRAVKWREKVVDAVGKGYVAQAHDEARARELLAEVSVDEEAASRLIFLWNVLRDANAKTLTAAQVKAAYKKNRYGLARAIDELEERGYTAEEAETYLTT